MSEPTTTDRPASPDRTNPEPASNAVVSHNEPATPQANSGQQVASNTSQAQEQPQQNRIFSTLRRVLFNLLIGWMISRYFFSGRQSGVTNLAKDGTPVKSVASNNLFNSGFNLDLYVYVTEDRHEPDFFNPTELKWVLKNIVYDDWTQGDDKNSIFSKKVELELSSRVQKNGSLWIHSYFVKHNYLPYEATRSGENFSPIYTLHRKKQLNKYKKRRYRDTHNLLTGKTGKSLDEQEKIKNKIEEEIISHWHPNLTINMVYDHTAWTPNALPAPLNEYIDFEPNTGKYYPIVYLNDYWNLLRDYQPLNETVKKINLFFTYQPLSMMKWQLYAAQGMRNKWSSMLGTEQIESEDEQDYIKEALLETSPILLALTIIFSVAHSICEFLAFKNDIQFWKDKKSLEGLSVRSVFFNLFQSVVVLLYVLDNDTNTLIKVSIGIGLLIELWKIPKVVSIKVDRTQKVFGILPKLTFEDKGSYVESSTKQYDMLAYKYLSWIIFPLFVGYAIYSLLYQEHKGWYSFILNMTYGFLLVFGFIMMTPQLFINYKLKSVAHLPWRMLTYKFLNTFIDDIFAFVIKMPLMYRIGCFRDDIIFIIYLYQRWIYRVDPKRVNEFGVSGDLQVEESTKALTGSNPGSTSQSTSKSKSSNQTSKSAADKKKD